MFKAESLYCVVLRLKSHALAFATNLKTVNGSKGMVRKPSEIKKGTRITTTKNKCRLKDKNGKCKLHRFNAYNTK